MELNRDQEEEYREAENREDEDEVYEGDSIFDELEQASRSKYGGCYKVIFAETVLLAAVVLSLVLTKNLGNHPGKMAGEYVKRMAQGEWNRAYDCLAFEGEESPVLDREMFVTAQSLNYDTGSIVRVRVDKTQEQKQKDKNKTRVLVQYTKNEETFQEEVFMTRKDGRWSVDGEKKLFRDNAVLMVPAGAVVQYDSMELDKSYLKSQDASQDVYEIPVTFSGPHYIRVSKEHMEEKELIHQFEKDKPVRVTLNYSGEVLKEAGSQAQEDIAAAFQKADTGKKIFVSMKMTENQVTVKNSTENPGIIEVTVNSRYEYRYKPGKYYWRARKKSGSCTNTCRYSFEDGSLKLVETEIEESLL